MLQSRAVTPALDWLLLMVGTGLGIVAVTADLIGLGSFPGFGWKQAATAAVALILVGWGAVRIIRHDRK